MNKAIRSIGLLGMFLFILCEAPQAESRPQAVSGPSGSEKPLSAFVHVNVIPMDREVVLLDQNVLVRGDRLIGFGPADKTPVPDGSVIIDGLGLFLLPGLTDAHVHIDQMVGARPDFGDAPLFLANGVTSVFNLRGEPQHVAIKKFVQEGKILAPDLYNAGEFVNEPRVNSPEEAEREVRTQFQAGYDIIKFREVIDFKDWRVLTTTGLEVNAYLRLGEAARKAGLPFLGHAPYRVGLTGLLRGKQSLAHMNELSNLYFFPPLLGKPDGFMTITEWLCLALLGFFLLGGIFRLLAYGFFRTSRPGIARAAEHLRPAIRLAGLAAVCAALWILVVPPGRLFGQVWLLAVLTAASILFWTGVIRLLVRSIKTRSDRTISIFSQVLNLVALLAALGVAVSMVRWVPLAWRGSDVVMDRVARNLKRAGVAVESTLVLYEIGMGTRDGFRYEQRIQDPSFRYLPQSLQKAWSEIRQMVPDWIVKVWARQPEFNRKLTGALYRAGVPILAGTDALGAPFIIPGASLHQELQLLSESGLSPYEVLRAATLEPARFLGKESDFGTIAAGKRASLVLVEKNPLQDLAALRKPVGVMVRGIWLPQDKLHDMLLDMSRDGN
jgi:hypothetical protein